MKPSKEKPFRIGIIGGMGPMAGMQLQKLIIQATPATRDQEHLQVLCFTNPQIPDRTASLLGPDRGQRYVDAVRASGDMLVRAGVDVIVIPCNTAHVRFDDIQAGLSVPVVHMVDLAAKEVARRVGASARVGLLATTATVASGVYQAAAPDQQWLCPLPEDQERLMDVIYRIKAGEKAEKILPTLLDLLRRIAAEGADIILLGCTELSLYTQEAEDAGAAVLDPLRIAAVHLVALAARSS